MVTEILVCAVPRLLDAVASRDGKHLRTFFSFVAPALVGGAPDVCDAQGDVSERRPYMLGYWCKVATMLCKQRPAAMVRFFDATPGVAEAMLTHMYNGNVGQLLSVVCELPFYGDAGMAACKLARQDKVTLPGQLLDALTRALPCGATVSQQLASRSDIIATFFVSLLTSAKSSSPHPKFAAEAYTDYYLRNTRAEVPSEAGDDHGERRSLLHESMDADAIHAAAAAAARTSASNALADGGSVTARYTSDATLIKVNVQVARTFHNAHCTPEERVSMRVFKSLRDGAHAKDAAQLACNALECATDLAVKHARVYASSAAQNALSAPLRVLAHLLDMCGYSYRQQVVFGFGLESTAAYTPGHPHGASFPAPPQPASGTHTSPCPALLVHLLPHLPLLTR
ncbi:hypothetical protein EON67_05195, partial [archaeon]